MKNFNIYSRLLKAKIWRLTATQAATRQCKRCAIVKSAEVQKRVITTSANEIVFTSLPFLLSLRGHGDRLQAHNKFIIVPTTGKCCLYMLRFLFLRGVSGGDVKFFLQLWSEMFGNFASWFNAVSIWNSCKYLFLKIFNYYLTSLSHDPVACFRTLVLSLPFPDSTNETNGRKRQNKLSPAM